MRKEIIEFEQRIEDQRLRSMAWWETSARCIEEKEALKDVFEAYEKMRDELTERERMLLDQLEEAWYLMKEAELQATYMQGISDGMEMKTQKPLKCVDMTGPKCRRVS